MGRRSLEKQMVRNFNQMLAQDGQYVTIKYFTKRPNVTNSIWNESEGIPWTYNNVLCLKGVISPLIFNDNPTANIQFSKADFYFPYIPYDFHGDTKKFLKIIDGYGVEHSIDKIEPLVKIGNSFLCWHAIQH